MELSRLGCARTVARTRTAAFAVALLVLASCGGDNADSDLTDSAAPTASTVDGTGPVDGSDSAPADTAVVVPSSNSVAGQVPSTEATAPNSAPSEPSGEPIKLGAIWSQSGALASIGALELAGAEMAVDEINARGGVLGRPIDLIQLDTASDANTAVSNVRRLIQSEGVIAIVGTESTATTKAVTPIVTEAQIPTISQQGGGNLTADDGYVFSNTFASDDAVRSAASWFEAQGVEKLGYLTVANDLGSACERTALPTLEERFDVVAQETIQPDASDLNVPLAALRSAGAESVFMCGSGALTVTAAKAYKQAELPGHLCFFSPTLDLASQLGDAADVAVFPMPDLYFHESLPASDHLDTITRYLETWEAAGRPGGDLNHQVASGYSAVVIIAETIEQLGAADPQAIYEAWTGGFDVPWNVVGPLRWDVDAHTGFNPDFGTLARYDAESNSYVEAEI